MRARRHVQSPQHLRLAALVVVAFATIFVAGAAESQNTQQREFAAIDVERLTKVAEEPGQWLTGGRDLDQSYFSPLTGINDENVTRLGYAWQFDTDTTNGLEATPIVVDGVMYTSGPWGVVYAVDAATGEKLWTFDPEVDRQFARFACCGIVNRGVSVQNGKVYVASLDGVLFALDARLGEPAWHQKTLFDDSRGYSITGAPYTAGDVVVIGNSGGEYDARGYISAYDIDTGELRWRFFTVPASAEGPHEHPELEVAAKTWDPDSLWEVGLGGTVWDGMAYDPELDLLYVGVGNSTPYARKVRSPKGGDNLYLASILAIRPATGKLVWHYQTTPAENWDYTATQKMILAELEIDGRERKVLMQAPKNGFFYVLDRETGELISAEPYVPVNWASHVDMTTGRPVETDQAEYFDEPKLIFPSPAGGHNWQPMAFNPGTGLVYIPALEVGAVFQIPDREFKYVPRGMNTYSLFSFSVDGPMGISVLAARGLDWNALKEGQPDPTARSILRAWDPVTQSERWQVNVSGPFEGQFAAIWNGSGIMTTAGNLVFQGRTTGELYAYAADTGELLHVVDLGTSVIAAPMTYELDGKQYVALMAGLGGAGGRAHFPGTAAAARGNAGRIIALTLDGGDVPKPPLRRPAPPPGRPSVERRGDTETIASGEALFEQHCTRCHGSSGVGGVPDLRSMSARVHDRFDDILLRGALSGRGMASFGDLLEEADSEAIHAFLIDRSWRAFEEAQNDQ